MKKLAIIMSVGLIFAACIKNDEGSNLEGSRWKYQSDHFYSYLGSSGTIIIDLSFDSPTMGHADISDFGEATGFTHCFLATYNVSYTYNDNDNSGTITFMKEIIHQASNYAITSSLYPDTITSAFYTYAGNNKMFLYKTPCADFTKIELTRE